MHDQPPAPDASLPTTPVTPSPASDASASSSAVSDVELVQQLAQAKQDILTQLRTRIIGQVDAIELLLVALLARGHGLLVGVPGLAKTSLVSALAESLSLHSNRIQFTPDLMPSDITGTDVLEQDPSTGQRGFRFVPGPVFTHILLADEINRTPPKTQAALLQAMEEHHVTAGGRTHPIEAPYMVFATQNPIEQEGTFPLPEAQLDRFMLQVNMAYPSQSEEQEIVRRTTAPEETAPTPALTRNDILQMQALVRRVPVADSVIAHAVDLVRATRPGQATAPSDVGHFLDYGAGPRASQALILGAKAKAVLDGRYAAEVEDVRALCLPILRHRLVLNYRAKGEQIQADALIADLLANLKP